VGARHDPEGIPRDPVGEFGDAVRFHGFLIGELLAWSGPRTGARDLALQRPAVRVAIPAKAASSTSGSTL